MTPAPNTKIKLDELNKILNEMKQGEEAVKKLAEMDKQMGMQDPAQVARRMRGERTPAPAGSDAALSDTGIANNLREQAERMNREANGLLAEAARLLKEAESLDPVKVVKTSAPKAKKAKTKVTA